MENQLKEAAKLELLLFAMPRFIVMHNERCWLTISATIDRNEWNACYMNTEGVIPTPYACNGKTPHGALEELRKTLQLVRKIAW